MAQHDVSARSDELSRLEFEGELGFEDVVRNAGWELVEAAMVDLRNKYAKSGVPNTEYQFHHFSKAKLEQDAETVKGLVTYFCDVEINFRHKLTERFEENYQCHVTLKYKPMNMFRARIFHPEIFRLATPGYYSVGITLFTAVWWYFRSAGVTQFVA